MAERPRRRVERGCWAGARPDGYRHARGGPHRTGDRRPAFPPFSRRIAASSATRLPRQQVGLVPLGVSPYQRPAGEALSRDAGSGRPGIPDEFMASTTSATRPRRRSSVRRRTSGRPGAQIAGCRAALAESACPISHWQAVPGRRTRRLQEPHHRQSITGTRNVPHGSACRPVRPPPGQPLPYINCRGTLRPVTPDENATSQPARRYRRDP